MRLLPDVVGGEPPRRGRLLLAAGAVAAAVTALAGCSQFDAALGQRQAVVTFQDSASLAQRLAVRSACKTPTVVPQPLPSNVNSPYALQQVIYQINKASNADVAVLEKCLSKFPSVVGVTLQDSSDEGN
jgi:hypothetical protein